MKKLLRDPLCLALVVGCWGCGQCRSGTTFRKMYSAKSYDELSCHGQHQRFDHSRERYRYVGGI